VEFIGCANNTERLKCFRKVHDSLQTDTFIAGGINDREKTRQYGKNYDSRSGAGIH
jgi:hypothetical protein